MSEAQRLTVRYQGRVQGVGFRFTAVRIAGDYDVTGYVRNLPDGSVELVAEGETQTLRQFLGAVRSSSLGRYMLEETAVEGPATGKFSTFSIRH